MRKNEKHVILCLLEVARRGAKFGKIYTHFLPKTKQTKQMNGQKLKIKTLMKAIHFPFQIWIFGSVSLYSMLF